MLFRSDADQREAELGNLARALGVAVPDWQARAREALARSQAKVARSRQAIERSQAFLRRDEARRQQRRARDQRERHALVGQIVILRGDREREQRETVRRTHAVREQARRLRSIARDSAERAASILNDTRAVRQQASIAICSGQRGQAQTESAMVLTRLTVGDGPLSVRDRPSSLKRDRDRRTTSTGESAL